MPLYDSIKRLVRHSAVYGLGHILSRSVGFILLPLYTNFFSTAGFGVAGLGITWLTVLTLLYSYGLDAGFMRYYILAEGEARRRIFATALSTLTLTSLFFSLLLVWQAPLLVELLFGADARATGIDLILILRYLAGTLLCDTVAFIPLLVLRADEKSWLYIAIKAGSALLFLGANLLFIISWRMGVEGMFLAHLVSSAVTLMLAVPVMIRTGFGRPSLPWLRRLLDFGLPFLPTGLAIALLDSGDRLLLERLASASAAGLYNAGAKVGMIMALLVAAFRFAWQPYFLATSRESGAREIFGRILTWMVAVCLTLFLLVSFFIEKLMHLRIAGLSFFGASFWQSAEVVPLIMLAYLFYALYLVFEAALYLQQKSGLIALVTLAGVVLNIASNLLLIPALGPLGAAWSRAIAYGAMAAGLCWLAQHHYPIPYEWPRLARLSLWAFLLFAVAAAVPAASHLAVCLALMAFWPFLLYATVLEPEEQQKIGGFLRKIFVHY